VILDGILGYYKIGYADSVDSVLQTGNLHLTDVLPVDYDRILLDFLKEFYDRLFFVEMEEGDEFYKD
jgi:hypothetical protein